jgi:hypothetical protein
MSLSQRKPLAALAAGTAALALALPVASASAATIPPVPVFPTVSFPTVTFPTISGLFTPGSLPCQLLDRELRLANQIGNTTWTNVVTNVFGFTGCGGATP